MSVRAWNRAQSEALEADNNNVLISAAAGSGKTSVLTERVIRRIKDDSTDISNMLIVTFTTMAAEEMKERIFAALYEAAVKHGSRLARQAEMLNDADICTIHSFCSRVIKENFEQAGVPPVFYTLSQGEADILRNEAMEELFEELYENEDTGFLSMVRRYCGRNDEVLKKFLFKIHNYFESLPDWEGWFTDKIKLQEAFAELGKDYDNFNIEALGEAADIFNYSADILKKEGFFETAQADESAALYVSNLKRIYEEKGRKAFLESAGGFERANYKGLDEDLADFIKILRQEARDIVKDIESDEYINNFEEKLKEEFEHVYPDMQELKRLYGLFSGRYSEIKKDKNSLDFNDLEHMAYRALLCEEVRQKYRNKYRYVFVDEYQDTSPIQEEILNLVSGADNRFMVGDLKQSIYRFRQADPMIFKNRAKDYGAGAREGVLIRMHDNYRSHAEIVSFVNYIMGNLMCEELGDIKYSGEEELWAASLKSGGSVSFIVAQSKNGEEDGEDEVKELIDAEFEAHIIAGEILKRMQRPVFDDKLKCGRDMQYGDIAILLREIKNTGRIIKRVLQAYGIPSFVESDALLSDYPEVGAFIDLLKITDNFRQDIPLIAVMRSSYGGFGDAELADIRINKPDGPFYQAFKAYSLEKGDGLSEKLRAFLEKIERFRLISQSMRLQEFLLIVERETGFGERLNALKGGKSKYSSLVSILENSGQAASGASESLNSFLRYIEDMQATGRLSDFLKPEGGKNTVKILSIHKSKGLEFGVVFLPRLSKQFNMNECRDNIVICRDIGPALKYVDEKNLIKKDTHIKRLAAGNIKRAALSEELRVLYVGLTRAKEDLYLIGSVKELKKNVRKWLKPASVYSLLKKNSCMDWLMPFMLKLESARVIRGNNRFSGELSVLPVDIRIIDSLPAVSNANKDAKGFLREYINSLNDNVLDELSFIYPYGNDLQVVSKQTVTKIKQKDAETFIRASIEEDTYTAGGEYIDAAKKGTVTHFVMRHIGFEEDTDIDLAIADLIKRELITKEESKIIDIKQIKSFLKSGLAKRVRASKTMLKEAPFCLKMKARELGYEGSEENVVVQGVIDLCFIEEGRWVLVDYKTDNVDEKTADIAARGYKRQLELYKRALEKITGIGVSRTYIYFFKYGTVEI